MNITWRFLKGTSSRSGLANQVLRTRVGLTTLVPILALTFGASLWWVQPAEAAPGEAQASTLTKTGEVGISDTLLGEMSQATQSLYNRIRQSLVIIKPSRNPDALLPPNLRAKFDRWKLHWIQHHHLTVHGRHFHPGRHSIPTVVIEPLRTRPDHHRRNPHLTPRQQQELDKIADDRPVEIFLLRHFLFRHGPGRTDLPWPILHGILMRLREIERHLNQTVYGLATGKPNRILVLEVLSPPGATAQIHVILPDGKAAAAHVYATNYFLNLTVLQLSSATKVPPIRMVRQLPRHPGLLLAVAADQPAVRWLVPVHGPGFASRRAASAPLMFFLRTAPHPAFIFSPSGELAAVTTWKKALGVAGTKSYIRNFIKYGQIEQVRFGIRYAMVPSNSPLRRKIPRLGRLRAMEVLGLYPHSPAQRAGIRPGDIIFGIDGIGLADFSRIAKKIHADPEHVAIRLARNGKIITVHVTLRPPPGFAPRHMRP
ncbi:MAG: hypothetical protein HKL95_10880 [Phycisphaerae bacterium]|nr:hypothetical protein [Phycisphaerae bacterium]